MEQDRFSGPAWERQHIRLMDDKGKRILLVDNQPYMSWLVEDDIAPRFAIAQICELGMGSQEELAKVFGITVRSVQNYIHAYRRDGANGLMGKKKGPKGSWKISPQVKGKILYLALNQGILAGEAIKKKLGEWGENVSIPRIRQVLVENGINENISAPGIEINQTDLLTFRMKGNCG